MIKFKLFITKFWQAWKKFAERLISNLALFGIYFIGIGLTSLVAKIFQRQFLLRSANQSTWQPITGSSKLTKMY